MALKARAHESDLRSGGGDQRQESLQATGIDFSPLVEPYKGFGKLTLRLEQMPPRARFSAGMRAGERSWSLTPDDLNGLNYLLPEGTSVDHSVKVRVIGMERGDTLAMLDVKVAQYVSAGRAGTKVPSAPVDAPVQGDQLARAQSAVGALQIQLSDALAEIKRLTVQSDADASSAAVAAARAQWQADDKKRQAILEADWSTQTQRQVGDVQSRLAEALRELEHLQTQQPETLAAQLSSARSEWKADEARRLATAEAAWARQSEEKIEELQAQLSEARKKHLKLQTEKSTDWQAELEAARAEWKDDEARRLARAEAQWTAKARDRVEELEAQLHDALAAHKRLASEISSDGKTDLDAARAAWKAEEMARLAQSEASWKSQLDFLKAELAKARTTQATVDTEDLQVQLRQIREELQTGFDQKLVSADAERNRTEAARLRDVEAHWKTVVQNLEGQLQAERAKPADVVAVPDDGKLRDAIASLQATVAERDAEFEQLHKQLDAERLARRKDMQDLRASHGATNQIEVELREQHAAELEQTEARWKQTAAAEIKSAKSRADLAESKLQELRAAAADAARLDKEVVILRATLSERELELHRLQQHAAATANADAAAVVPAPTGIRKLLATPYFREGLVGVACTVAAVLLVPGSGVSPSPSQPADVAQVVGQADAGTQPLALQQTAVVRRNTRLRLAPVKDADVLVRVERGVEVGVIKSDGGWTQVKMNHKTKVVEGWIESDSLDLPQTAARTTTP